jgi:hypothetical protein
MRKIILLLISVGALAAQTQQTATINGATNQQLSAGSVHIDPNKVAADTGAANAYVIAPTVAVALTSGVQAYFTTSNANTGSSTINVSSTGVKSLTKYGTTALIQGDIVSGVLYTAQYDGTQWQLLNPSTSIACPTCTTAASTMTLNYPVAGSGSRGVQTTTNNPQVVYTIASPGASPVITLSNGNVQEMTLTATATATVVTTSALPGDYTIIVCEGSTLYGFTFPATFRGATTAISTGSTASKCNSQTFTFDGTNIYAKGLPTLNF